MDKPHLFAWIGFSLFLTTAGCSRAPDFWKEAKVGQKKILVSFPPLYCITHAVAGDDAYVLTMLTSQGPHEYDGGPADALKVSRADLVIYNGLTLDDLFIEKMLRSQKKDAVKTLDVGEAVEEKDHDLLIEAHAHEDKGGHVHKHGDHDPHIWLGPPQAIAMTRIIAKMLAEIDPSHKKGYEDRAESFVKELEKLQKHGETAFKDKTHKAIVTQHESLGYFAKAFKLQIVGSIQVKPGADPDSASLARLVKLCSDKEKPVKVIAVEPQYSKAQAETLQTTLKGKGIDVRIVLIDPIETAPIADGKLYNPDPGCYLKKMRENIDTLAEALP